MTAAAADEGGGTAEPAVDGTAADVLGGSVLVREWPQFREGVAPGWPFVGVVQLWAVDHDVSLGEADAVWWLRFWSWDEPSEFYAQVPLPGLEIECLGQVGMVSHRERGIEVGGAAGAVSGSFLVRWGGGAQRLAVPSDELLAEIEARPSSSAVSALGDAVSLGVGGRRVSNVMRDPGRQVGDWWRAQARHDGPLFVLSVHPAHLECFSGVTWVSVAATGEVVACGANTWATKFIAPQGFPLGELVLPEPEQVGTYLGCGARLELTDLPFTADRQIAR